MTDLSRFQKAAALPGSPVSILSERIAAELAEGRIPAACPHVLTLSRLYLPARILCCEECAAGMAGGPGSVPGPCSSCQAPGASGWTTLLDAVSRVLVIARTCEPCRTAGNVPAGDN